MLTLNYKETLMGEREASLEKGDDFLFEDDDFYEEEEDLEFPTIPMTRKDKIELCHRWHQTLIIKVMGRAVGYNYLLRRIRILWKPKANMVITVENDYFLVRLGSREDYRYVKY